MKWKNKPKIEYGNTRERTRFAFFPITDGRITVWLELVKVKEMYNAYSTYPTKDSSDPGIFGKWDVIEIVKDNK